MDFAINLTLIVQALNFIIAVFILKELWLKAAVNELMAVDKYKTELRQDFIIAQEAVRLKQKNDALRAQEWQKQLYLEQPPIFYDQQISAFSSKVDSAVEVGFSDQEINSLAQAIVKKVKAS